MNGALILDAGGNLIAYNSNGTVAWTSKTQNSGADRLEMQDDGNLVHFIEVLLQCGQVTR